MARSEPSAGDRKGLVSAVVVLFDQQQVKATTGADAHEAGVAGEGLFDAEPGSRKGGVEQAAIRLERLIVEMG